MLKPQVFEHAYLLLHDEARLLSELQPQTDLGVVFGEGLLGGQEGVVVVEGEDVWCGCHG